MFPNSKRPELETGMDYSVSSSLLYVIVNEVFLYKNHWYGQQKRQQGSC